MASGEELPSQGRDAPAYPDRASAVAIALARRIAEYRRNLGYDGG